MARATIPRLDPRAPHPLADERVEEEGVRRPVPRHVHEPNQVGAVARTDPAEAPPLDLALPVVGLGAVSEPIGVPAPEDWSY